jgi:phosphinothricin acetyltransferase
MEYRIDEMTAKDWESVEEIYLEGIASGNATFETKSPGRREWNRSHLPICRLAAKKDTHVVGWAALSPYSSRSAYAGVAEVSIYVASSERGKGVGERLLRALIEESEREGIWTLQAGIFPENTASLSLHKAYGFREVGTRERIGQLNGLWRDVVLLERRSTAVGV